jgi:hypothetical protein
VTETETHKKEFSISIKHNPESPFYSLRQSDEDRSLATVADALEDIRKWVDGIDDDEWELNKFTLTTTIVAQRTETDEEGSTSE